MAHLEYPEYKRPPTICHRDEAELRSTMPKERGSRFLFGDFYDIIRVLA